MRSDVNVTESMSTEHQQYVKPEAAFKLVKTIAFFTFIGDEDWGKSLSHGYGLNQEIVR